MKLSKFDIGAEVISILTKGMYQDPRDAIREYIQNGIDAGAENISIKVRQNSVVIIDDGSGMDYNILRKAIRVGVSDKDPKKKVGFMGIGIYSSFHLCEKLIIYTHKQNNLPLKLEMDFLSMRNTLKEQKQLRMEEKLDPNDFIDLQTLLENYVDLTNEGDLTNEDFPSTGTRVELVGLEGNFINLLSDFNKLSNYLREVVPLHFNENEFVWSERIESEIQQICQKYDSKFQLINLTLQVNAQTEKLYRPYSNTDFTNGIPNEPLFKEIRQDEIFLGVVWGCLNSDRKKIPNRELRGFLIKKQGFAIGNRDKIAPYFNQRTHFDRYVGEIVLTNSLILPNSSRSDLEYSKYSTTFFEILAKEIAPYYIQQSNIFQEQEIAKVQIFDFKKYLNDLNLRYKRDEKDSNVLVQYIVQLNDEKNKVREKDKNSTLTDEQRKDFKELNESAELFIQQIQDSINCLTKNINSGDDKKIYKSKTTAQVTLAKKLSKIKTIDSANIRNYDNLLMLLEDLDIELTDEIKFILSIIDERFIQGYSNNLNEYYKMLIDLRDEIIKMVD